MANAMRPTLFLALLFFLSFNSSFAGTYNVITYGAKADGVTDTTNAFNAAWIAACGSIEAATIFVPGGRFLVGSNMVFNGGSCKSSDITITIKGTLVAPGDYNVLGNAGYWLSFESVNGVSIVGGVLDGQGSSLWACKTSGEGCPSGATTLTFTNSKNVVVNGLTSLNSQLYHIVFNGCQNVTMQGLRLSAAGTSPNTDGIHVQFSTDVTILNSRVGTGDDCVSIGPGTQNLWIENIACGPGHGVSIGSLGKSANEAGVQNVTVKRATFSGTQNGFRIKSWARASTGFAQNILFQHGIMNNVQNPIVIDQNYCPNNQDCPGQVSGIQVSDVTYNNVSGSSATKVAVKFDCSSGYPCTGITLENVQLTYKNQRAEASCANAAGTASGLVQPSSCL
ncbi:hypothetical protein SLE2022_106240 [Rubroshorea leprosula]